MEIVTENATSLAWIGDALFSLRIREHILEKGYQSPKKLQQLSSRYCSAKGQAKILEALVGQTEFSEAETEILRRGRSAHVHTIAKNADGATYMKATALEALLGYLHLYHHPERLQELLDLCVKIGDEIL